MRFKNKFEPKSTDTFKNIMVNALVRRVALALCQGPVCSVRHYPFQSRRSAAQLTDVELVGELQLTTIEYCPDSGSLELFSFSKRPCVTRFRAPSDSEQEPRAAPRAEEDPAQVLHPEARLPRRRARQGGRRPRARGAREAGLPVSSGGEVGRPSSEDSVNNLQGSNYIPLYF